MRTRVSTNAYAAKRALFARLREVKADPAGPFVDWLISYSDPGVFGQGLMIYGGGAIWDQSGEDDVQDGDDTLVSETAVLGLHIRVEQSPDPNPDRDPVEVSDEIAETMGDALAQVLADDPHLCGGHSVARIVGGQCDHYHSDEKTVSVLTLRVSVQSNI